jgi:hypothetical protein
VTIFLARVSGELVGVELNGLSTILRAVEGLGETGLIEKPITINHDGKEETVDLRILVGCALVERHIEPVSGKEYEELAQASGKVKVSKKDLCSC